MTGKRSSEERHGGGCLCGAVRFETEGEPVRASVCHCRYCQLRTGSAFGISVYFPADKVTRLSGETEIYTHPSESGNRWRIERCARCGTPVFWTIDGAAWAGLQGTSGGCYDPPTFWYSLKWEVFTRSKAGFCEVEAPESHRIHPVHDPVRPDPDRLSGGQ